jgi:hypothetical protein
MRWKLYNHYLKGDDVFEEYIDPGTLWGTTCGAERYAWQKQERFKGRGGIHGTDFAGWGFERNIFGVKVYTETQVNDLSFAQLAIAPAFYRQPDALFDPNEPWSGLLHEMLAKGIPALSHPIGAGSVGEAKGAANFDTNATAIIERPNGWPQVNRGFEDRTRWLHNDVKDVAYFFTYKLFDKLVDEGGLK